MGSGNDPKGPKDPMSGAVVHAQTVETHGHVEKLFVVQGEATFNLPPPRRAEPRKSNLPPRRHDFVGRGTELAELHRLLTFGTAVALDQGPTPPSGLTGLGGVGKSTLATEYAYRHLGEYEHVCWVNAEGSDIAAGIAALVDDPLSLGLPAEASMLDQVRAVLARLERGGPHLLILDNVSDPDSYPSLLPQTGAVRVIITTRRTDLHGVRRLSVEVLPEEDALRLMLGELQVSVSERNAAHQLCFELGCLTLAVAVAGRLLETRQLTPSTLLALVQEKGPLELPETPYAKDVLGARPSVRRLFDASLAQLDVNNPVDAHARRLLWVGGWFAPVEIPRGTFFDAGARLAAWESVHPWWRRLLKALRLRSSEPLTYGPTALDRLIRLGLVQLDEGGLPKLHRLVGAYARSRGGLHASVAVLDALGAVASTLESETQDFRRIVPYEQHMEAAVARLSVDSSEAHLKIAAHLSRHYQYMAGYTDCSSLMERLKPQLFNGDLASYLNAEENIETPHQGSADRALEYYGRALAIKEKVQGAENSDAESTHGIKSPVSSQGMLDAAFEYYGRALAIKEKARDVESLEAESTLGASGQNEPGTLAHLEELERRRRTSIANDKPQSSALRDVTPPHIQPRQDPHDQKDLVGEVDIHVTAKLREQSSKRGRHAIEISSATNRQPASASIGGLLAIAYKIRGMILRFVYSIHESSSGSGYSRLQRRARPRRGRRR